jgi:hypothetical protein
VGGFIGADADQDDLAGVRSTEEQQQEEEDEEADQEEDDDDDDEKGFSSGRRMTVSVRARRNWRGALLLGSFGASGLGFALGGVVDTFTGYQGGYLGVLIGSIAVLVGLGVFSACGLFCLPAEVPLDSPTLRGLLEGLVVVAWIIGVGFWAMYAAKVESQEIVSTMNILYRLLFVPTPVYFVLLCWHNIDWQIMRLLWMQFQCKMVVALDVHVMVMYAWREMAVFHSPFLFAIAESLSVWSPLLMVLFLDAMGRQSRLFRVAMPVVYLAYVVVTYIYYGYIHATNPIVFLNTTEGVHSEIAAVAGSFEGQISGSLLTLIFLMLTFLTNSIEDVVRAVINGSVLGSAISFPLRIATIMKASVPLIIEGGGILKTEVDVNCNTVVLVADDIFRDTLSRMRSHRNHTGTNNDDDLEVVEIDDNPASGSVRSESSRCSMAV